MLEKIIFTIQKKHPIVVSMQSDGKIIYDLFFPIEEGKSEKETLSTTKLINRIEQIKVRK